MANLRAPRQWLHQYWPWLAGAVLLLLVLSQLSSSGGVPTGSKAPGFQVQLTNGSSFELEEHLGKPVVLNFWASWCAPCRYEAPVLERAHEQLAEQGGVVLGVSLDRGSPEAVQRAAEQLGMQYPIAMNNSELSNAFNVRELPTTFVIGPRGTIVQSRVGAVSDGWLRSALEEARERNSDR